MRLHEDFEAFDELLEATAEKTGLAGIYIEKDYWVTYALRNLFTSELADEVVFKGGTSLSKAYRLIDRFSEDIDLAVVTHGRTGNKLKQLMKRIEQATTRGLTPIESAKDPRISKRGNIRSTVYRLPITQNGEWGDVSPELLLEINAFTRPTPTKSRKVQTYITDFLKELGRQDLIEHYGMEGFPMTVLCVKRTLVEKLLCLVKEGGKDTPIPELSKKIRHFYDLARILAHKEYRVFAESSDFAPMCKTCIQDENVYGPGKEEKLNTPLHKALLFSKFDGWLPELQASYEGSFRDLVHGPKPTMTEIGEVVHFLHAQLQKAGV